LNADAMYVTPTGMVCTEWVERDKNGIFHHVKNRYRLYINDVLDALIMP
jgi:hypothetical protein